MNKPVVLAFISHYLPGYKCGGPVRSLANMVAHLGREYQFRIVTTDRDLGDDKPYQGILSDQWTTTEGAEIIYLSSSRLSLTALANFVRETPHDILYLNSGFDRDFTLRLLLLRFLRILPKRPVIVAARGVFSPGALGIKSLKKRLFIAFVRGIGLYRGIVWQASSIVEASDIKKCFGEDSRVSIAPNLPALSSRVKELPTKPEKQKGALKIIFLSRISPKKNLLYALNMLQSVKGRVNLNIYGPLEDMSYWAECQRAIAGLPQNVFVEHCGDVHPDQVISVLRAHDLLFFPTLGENYGHVILESFCSGCPVLTSNRTPWNELQKKGIGWDLPLEQPELFLAALGELVEMGGAEYAGYSDRARKYGLGILESAETVEGTRQLFKLCAESQG